MSGNKLWRYYDLIKFLALVNGELYFARADKFKDKYEGAIPKQNFLHFAEFYYQSEFCNDATFRNNAENRLETLPTDLKIHMDRIPSDIRNRIRNKFLENFRERKKKVAISCWHLNESESAAMWEVYSRAGQGIAVSTTLEKLEKLAKPCGFEMEMFKVDYIDFDKTYDKDYISHELLPFKIKRKEFEYEHEFRIMLYKKNEEFNKVKEQKSGDNSLNNSGSPDSVSELDFLPEEGISISINTCELIDEMIASPDMKEYEVAEIQNILDLINQLRGTNYTLKKSGLYENLNY